MGNVDDLDSLTLLEAMMASHRGFGDSGYIAEQMRQRHRFYLVKMAGRLPAAERILAMLEGADDYQSFRALGATVVRCAIQHAYLAVDMQKRGCLSLDRCAEILQAAADVIDQGDTGCLPLRLETTRSNRVGDQPHDGSAWQEPPNADVLSTSFAYLVSHNYKAPPGSATPADLENLRAGAQLLRSVAPRLAGSTLSHAHLVVVFPSEGRWRGTGSSSQFRLPGTIFLSRTLIEDPWAAAEQLLHESLHQKLYDFRIGHRMFRPVDTARPPALVTSPWNSYDAKQSNRWDTFRVFAAFHVYVHLAFLCRAAQVRSRRSPAIAGLPDSVTLADRVRAATVRARYLGEQLTKPACWDELGPAGHRFHRWLSAVLDAMDPNPPPPDAILHLQLDLYRKETRSVQGSMRLLDVSAVQKLLLDDLGEASSLLLSLGAEPRDTAALVLTFAQDSEVSADLVGSEFSRVRSQIADLLLRYSSDGYRLDGVHDQLDPNVAASQMIQRSSERVSEMLSAAARH